MNSKTSYECCVTPQCFYDLLYVGVSYDSTGVRIDHRTPTWQQQKDTEHLRELFSVSVRSIEFVPIGKSINLAAYGDQSTDES